MKSVLQAEDTEGERHIFSISTLLIFNTIFSRKLKQGVTCSHRIPLIIFYYFIGIAINNMFFSIKHGLWTADHRLKTGYKTCMDLGLKVDLDMDCFFKYVSFRKENIREVDC